MGHKIFNFKWICCVKEDTLECLCKPSNDLSHPTLFTQPNKLKLMVKTRVCCKFVQEAKLYLSLLHYPSAIFDLKLSQDDALLKFILFQIRLFTMLLSHKVRKKESSHK